MKIAFIVGGIFASTRHGEAEVEERAKHKSIAYKMKLLIDLVRVTDFAALFIDVSSLRNVALARSVQAICWQHVGDWSQHRPGRLDTRINVHHLTSSDAIVPTTHNESKKWSRIGLIHDRDL